MKTQIDKFRAQISERNAKKQAAAAKLNELNEQLNQITNRINAAIANEDTGTAADLIRQRSNINVDIEVQTLTLENLSKNGLDREQVSEAYRADLADREKRIDALRRQAEKAKADMIAAAVALNAENREETNLRWEYLTLCGIEDDPKFKKAMEHAFWRPQEIPVEGFPFPSPVYYLPESFRNDLTPEQIQLAKFK